MFAVFLSLCFVAWKVLRYEDEEVNQASITRLFKKVDVSGKVNTAQTPSAQQLLYILITSLLNIKCLRSEHDGTPKESVTVQRQLVLVSITYHERLMCVLYTSPMRSSATTCTDKSQTKQVNILVKLREDQFLVFTGDYQHFLMAKRAKTQVLCVEYKSMHSCWQPT